MKALLIVNPTAGRGAALGVWRRLEGLVAGRPGLDAVVPGSAAEARDIAGQAAASGVDRIIAIGGDGTLALVANALARSETALGVIPAGTGNDFGRSLGIPRRPEEALEVALGTDTRAIDIGEVAGGRRFLNVAGTGFDADVAAAAARFPMGLGGMLPYLLGAVATLVHWAPVPMDITVDDQVFSGPHTLVAVANGQFYGGGLHIAPGADNRDGLFDVIMAGELTRPGILGIIPQVQRGVHIHHPAVRVARGRMVQIRAAAGVHLHLDGELHQPEALEFRTLPGALTVAAPGR